MGPFYSYEDAYNAVKQHLAKKVRSKYYSLIVGYFTENDEPKEYEIMLSWTDEEVARIKQLLVEEYNIDMDEESKVSDYKEVLKEVPIYEFEICNQELSSLLFKRVEDPHIFSIDLENVYYRSYYSLWAYNEKALTMHELKKFNVELDDEKYAHLVARRILMSRAATFVSLFKSDPEIATKISEAANNVLNYGYEIECPYMVLMDDVNKDAIEIAGPDEEYLSLLFKSKPVFHSVYARTVGRDLLIINSKSLNSLPLGTVPTTLTASADEVMRILDKPTYYLTMLELDNMFGKKDTVYEDIKAFFQEKGIAYTEETPD